MSIFAAKTVGMALSSVQGAVITKKYICGGYQAEYSFEIHYQIAPPGTSDDTRLKAVEALNALGIGQMLRSPTLARAERVLQRGDSGSRDLPCLPCMKTGTNDPIL